MKQYAAILSFRTGGYHNAIRYCFLPRPGKGLEALDEEPLLFPSSHAPLIESIHKTYSAAAWKDDQVAVLQSRSSRGKSAPRFSDTDLWPYVVEENISASDPVLESKLFKVAKAKGGKPMIEYLVRNFDQLRSIVQRLWKLENAEHDVAQASKTRLSFVMDAAQTACICSGAYPRAFRQTLQQNQINEAEFTSAIFLNLLHGRKKGLSVALLGVGGNEGKTFLLAPMRSIFPPQSVYGTPQQSSFPLLGIEGSRVCLWDDWRFSAQVLHISTQLLLMEGAEVTVNRPQNLHHGHLTYTGSAPFFITGRLDDIYTVKSGVTWNDLQMLHKRLTIFKFHHVVDSPDIGIPKCPSCWARLILSKGKNIAKFQIPDGQG